jgi:uncharacterized protein (DUF1810 family)
MSLDRFVGAQALMYQQAFNELVAGQKQTHWMWFVFPQLRGLGTSPMSQLFGLEPVEAVEWLGHPILRPRLIESVALLSAHGRPARVLGATDFVKLRSCLTLFEWAANEAWGKQDLKLFGVLADQWYGDAGDARCRTTLRLLG